ncbi:MAG: acetyltransferase [Hydrogenophaga sp.]|uniref:acetyltransferase n=1 Tax=Hydrogenophaga sp. TaxID=1904254 RepID=UPI002732EFFA|nr:acetyltransferase [Hydrogenophaga sp.]MDP3625767.1 acetyltransferase [Hydrogenophaga sp.]MDZ4057780.1 acetyltransferase [Polynucleobacter sp.]
MSDIRRHTASPLVLVGAGGHARVLKALIEAAGLRLLGVVDPVLAREKAQTWLDLPVLGDDLSLMNMDAGSIGLVHGIGQTPGSTVRYLIYNKLYAAGFRFPPLIHPHAWVAPDALLADGVQVMAGAVVQPACRIGENTIVNTRASIDHDGNIGSHVHVAPGAVLCGGITLESGVFIGAGAVLLSNLKVGSGATVAAGSTLSRDLGAGAIHHRTQRSAQPTVSQP